MYRIEKDPLVSVVGTALVGSELSQLITDNSFDVLLMELRIPASTENNNAFPVRRELASILEKHKSSKIIVTSALNEPTLIHELFDIGIHGYILKDDHSPIKNLPSMLRVVAGGGIYMSAGIQFYQQPKNGEDMYLTSRQLEALSFASYPDESSVVLAKEMGISESTFRNFLSAAYKKLGVRTRISAVLKGQELESFLPDEMEKII